MPKPNLPKIDAQENLSEEVTLTPDSLETPILPKLSPAPSTPALPLPKSTKKRKILRIILVVLLFFLVTSVALGVYTYSIATQMFDQVAGLQPLASTAYAHFKEQNLKAVEQDVTQLQSGLGQLDSNFKRLSFYRFTPFFGAYYKDAQSGLDAAQAGLSAGLKSIQAVTPYADVLGFTGEGSFAGGTAEDRLKILLGTLDKVTPQLDAVAGDLKVMEEKLLSIDPARYPEQFKGMTIREKVVQVQELARGAVSAVTEFRPVIEQLPSIAGSTNGRKKYLILFQNDNELRPTGGFMTAYAIVNIENGKVEPEKSDDIYELDKKFLKKIPIPEALGRYLTTEKSWHLRDMNISPDFKLSMEQFYANYSTVKGEPAQLDGIIAVNTEFLTDLLRVLGPVEVPGYGTFGAENDKRCDCPQIIYVLSEIITKPTPYIREDRKGIIGPLMRSLLTKAYTAPKQTWPALFEAGLQNMAGRHLQVFFLDENAQKAAEAAGAGGRMVPPTDGSDFLALVNANLGGAKSNLFVDYEMEQVVEAPQNGFIKKTVTVTYKNSRKADNCNLEAGQLCLNSTLRDWTRVYLPTGTKLVEAQGFTQEVKTYEENGFSVVDGFFTLEPLGTAKIKLTLEVPYSNSTEYRLQIWKQGGVEAFKLLVDAAGNQQELTVNKDSSIKLAF